MTESKKKTTKKEVVEKKEDAVKPVKKAKVKESKEKLIEQALEEETIPEKEEKPVKTTAPKKSKEEPKEELKEELKEEAVETAQPAVAAEAEVKVKVEAEVEAAEEAAEKKVKKPKKVKAESEPEEKSEPDIAPSVEEFDWESFEREELKDSPKHKEYEAMYDETLSTVAVDEVVHGTVIQMTSREVVINIGYKSEGVVSLNEFRYNPNLKVGDTVEVYVESQEDKKGQLLLSHKKARAINSWDRVNASLEKDEIITGYIKCRTKGGMIVDVFGIEAFLPGSQIDVKPIRDYDVFVGKTMEFKVVKINRLIHITDLSWGRVNHPEEIVQLDQKLNVVILDFDDDKKRIALGLKQLTPHPWDSVDPDMKIGNKVKGKVVVMADYGAFVEIAPGVEGLIHVSEMSWSQHLRSAQEFMKVGDEVEAVILTLDRAERKMSLGIKQLKPDPWQNINEKYTVGSKHMAKVRNFTNFGVFVEIEEGVDGLIHISDLSWTKKIKHPAEFTAIDAEIEVVVLEIDKENRRLSLGHKQLEENPWDVFEGLFTVDSVHEGTVMEVFDKGAVIALPYGVEGFATPKHIVKEDGTIAKVDEKLMFKVIEFNKSAKKIIVSHSRIFEDEKKAVEAPAKKPEAETPKKSTRKAKANVEKTTLGDITQLAALKEEMEEKQNKASKK
ncbi:MAG: 30S ribosomal protein S1 [Bacteroidia bacterium]|nr:30S ribosomal protein S1 [Bacteroidia bacterium]